VVIESIGMGHACIATFSLRILYITGDAPQQLWIWYGYKALFFAVVFFFFCIQGVSRFSDGLPVSRGSDIENIAATILLLYRLLTTGLGRETE
jgi:hypothetical protein